MFDGIFYTSTFKRRPLQTPAAVSVVLHTAAILFLMLHPEVVFPGKIFERKKEEPVHTGPLKNYDVVMVDTSPFVPPTRVPQTNVLSERDQTAESQPTNLNAPDKTTPASKGDDEFALEISRSKRKARRADRARSADELAKATLAGAGKKSRPGGEGAGKEVGEGDAAGRKKSERIWDLSELVLPKKELPKLPPPVVPPAGPGKDPTIGNGVEGKDPNSVAKEPAAGTARGESRAAASDLRPAKNSESALKSSGNSVLEAKGFQPGDEYVRELSRRIQNKMYYPGDLKRIKNHRLMTISFHIERDGRISQLKVINPTGDHQFDMMALNAVFNSAPFPPLPKWFPKEYALVEYTPLP